MRSSQVKIDGARKAVVKLTSAELFETVKMLADPALRSALSRLADQDSSELLENAKSIHQAVETLVSPELASALEKFESPEFQKALRSAAATFHPPTNKW